MKLGSFYLQMHWIVTELIPDIDDDFRSGSDEPSIDLTVDVGPRGWSYQTEGNSFPGGAYGYMIRAVVTLFRDSDPHDLAEDIIDQLGDVEFDAVTPKEHSEPLEALRIIAKGKVHGAYCWAAVMSDGALLCETCVRKEYRQIFKVTRDHVDDGWAVQGIANSSESDCTEVCANCTRTIWEK